MRWIILTAVVFLIAAMCIGGMLISYYNQAVEKENQFEAAQTNIINEFDVMKKVIMKSGKVTKAQADIIEKVIIQHAQARGGSGGMTLVNAVKESVPDIPVETFTNLQNIIVGASQKFAAKQTQLLDIKREHDNLREKFFSSFVCGSRPELVAKLITSTAAQQALETGVDDDMSIGLE